MKKLIWAVILILSISIIYAVDYPKLNNFVTDNANVIDDASEAALNDLAKQIEQQSRRQILRPYGPANTGC